MANPSTHKGHRERLKNRFLGTGLDSFTDVQALELLLFYAIPGATPTRRPTGC